MRGLAALCVAIYHFAEGAVFGGYLAVDFFFVLSGFVLMNTYGDRLAAGMSGGHFIKLRIVRIMPVYWLGQALCAMVYGVKLATHRPVDLDFSGYTVAAGLGAMMLPDPFAPRLFPLNPPAWSLFGEMVLNVAMAFWLARFSGRQMLAVLVVSGILLIGLAWHMQGLAGLPHTAGWVDAESELNRGPHWQGWYIGLLRTCFSFSAGMMIARLPQRAERPRSLAALVFWALLVVVLCVQLPAMTRLYFDILVIFALSPLLVVLCSRIEPPAAIASMACFLGEISFPLYALQWGLIGSVRSITQKLHLAPAASVFFYLFVTIFVAWVCTKWVDKPLRRIMAKILLPYRP